MDENVYYRKLGEKRTSRLNQIIYAVNCKVPKANIRLDDEVEEMYFDRLMMQAKAHEEKYHEWPSFEMGEIESDDPCLDIYNDSI